MPIDASNQDPATTRPHDTCERSAVASAHHAFLYSLVSTTAACVDYLLGDCKAATKMSHRLGSRDG